MGEADVEVAALKARYLTVKTVADEWRQKVDTLVKEWELLDNTVTDLNAWVAKDKTTEGENQFSLEKMESTLGELKNIFKQRRNWWIISKSFLSFLPLPDKMKIAVAKGMLGLKIACLPIDNQYLH